VDGGPLPSGLHPPPQKYFPENVGDGGRRGRGGRRFLAKKKFQKYFPNLFWDNRRVKNTFSELFGPQFFTVFLNI
jgi:phosphatidylserine decarboxylase